MRKRQLTHLNTMHERMNQTSSDDDNDDVMNTALVELAQSIVDYSTQTQITLEDYQQETHDLQAKLNVDAKDVLKDIQQSCAPLEELKAHKETLSQAQQGMQRYTEERQRVYTKLFATQDIKRELAPTSLNEKECNNAHTPPIAK